MFVRNEVFQWDSKKIRILLSHPKLIFWIDIEDKSALPKSCKREELERLMAENSLKLTDDPYIDISLTCPKEGSKSESIQIKAWDTIREIVEDEPNIYKRDKRGILVETARQKSKVTKQTIYRWLRRYWQFGMCVNALSARYENCGGAGKPKTFSEKANGRARTRNKGTTTPITEDIKCIFRVTIEKHFLTEDRNSFDYAYNQMLIAFGVKIPATPEDLIGVPTKRQFDYFFKKEYCPIQITRKRTGEIDYLKDISPNLGTSTAEVPGPGYLYQIDATIADVYLVSEEDPEKIVGRPTMYFVVDVFSRAIVGMYVGLENPSWVSAMEALGNTILDKVDYCKNFGVPIAEQDWPMQGLPENIIGDKGEMLGKHVEVLSKSFHVEIQNTPAYRADWKGIVERYFRTVQTKMQPFVEGYVTKNPIGKKRHGKDYRLDGTLTLNQFTAMIIKIVLYYNNENEISTYDIDSGLPVSVPNIPIDLWEWGIENRTGCLRTRDRDLVWVNLLPHTTATITDKGLKLFGCYYSCKEALDWGWFESNYKGKKSVEVAYDLYSTNKIYLRPSKKYSEFIVASLTIRSRAFENITFWELWEIQEKRRDVSATSKLKQRSGDLNLTAELEKIAREARNKQPNYENGQKKSRIKGLSENKRSERSYERDKKNRERQQRQEYKESSQVIPIKVEKVEPKSFGIPTRMKDLLKDNDDD